MHKRFIMIFFILLLAGVSAFGQQNRDTEKNIAFMETGITYQLWKVQPNYEAIHQAAFPLALVFPMGKRMMVNISNTPAISWWGDHRRITGISDTWIQTNYELIEDKLILNLGMTLPSGKTRLDTNQYVLSKAVLSRNLFQFQLPLYGQGMNMKIGLMNAFKLGDKAMLGVGCQYIAKSAYHPVEWDYIYKSTTGQMVEGHWDLEYEPGDEIMFQIGMDVLATKNLRLSFDGFYTIYNRDMLGGQEIYGSGNKLSLNVDMFYRYGLDKHILSHLTFRQSGKNELLHGVNFNREDINSNGPQFEWDLQGSVLSDEFNYVDYLITARYYGKSQIELSPIEFVLGMGLTSMFKLNESLACMVNLQYFFGGIETDSNKGIVGLESKVKFRYSF